MSTVDPRTSNLVGTFALALADSVREATEQGAAHGAAAPAALVNIFNYPAMTIEGLRRILRLSHPGTVRLVDRLAEGGLVERRAGRDGRSVALVLTRAGNKTVHTLLEHRRRTLEEVLGALTKPEQEQLTRLIEKLLFNMTEDLEHAYYVCRLCEDSVCPPGICPVEQAAEG